MSTVTGVTDWEFLRPDHASSMGGEEDPAHKVTLDDFDGEIAVFQVSERKISTSCSFIERI